MTAFSRLASFAKYPSNRILSVIGLTNDGFRYNETQDVAHCDHCQAVFSRWEEGMKGAHEVHTTWCEMRSKNEDVIGFSFSPTALGQDAGRQLQTHQFLQASLLATRPPFVVESALKKVPGWPANTAQLPKTEKPSTSTSEDLRGLNIYREIMKKGFNAVKQDGDRSQLPGQGDTGAKLTAMEETETQPTSAQSVWTGLGGTASSVTKPSTVAMAPADSPTGDEEKGELSQLSWTLNLIGKPWLREIVCLPVTAELHQPPGGEEESADSQTLAMRFERLRYASFAGDPTLGAREWPRRLSADGFFFDADSGIVECYYCRCRPHEHQANCRRRECNVQFGATNGPPISSQDMLQIMGVKPKTPNLSRRGVQPGPDHVHATPTASRPGQETNYADRSARLWSLQQHHQSEVNCAALADAGFYAGRY